MIVETVKAVAVEVVATVGFGSDVTVVEELSCFLDPLQPFPP